MPRTTHRRHSTSARKSPGDAFSDFVKRDFYRRLGWIAAGTVPLVLLASERGPLRFVCLLAFLLVAFQVIMLIASAQETLDAFFPPKGAHRRGERASHRYLTYFASGYFILSIVLLMTQLRRIDDTLGGMRLFWIAGAAGLPLALLLTFLVRRLAPSVYDEGGEHRFTMHFGLIVGSFLLGPSVASHINYSGPGAPLHCIETRFIEKTTSSRNKVCYIHIEAGEGSTERLEVSGDLFDALPGAGAVILCTRTGVLGFPVVETVQPAGAR
ncbi:hypothetical protein [Flaviaesturariibacter amylovorans]|uniref:DUF805 domain-containing protein n=1 Tax=Flaviaesturariibacter amylovorans TaxID=1084520 RepID=A0ABP8G502_9BACT